MKKKSVSRSAFFNPRVLIGLSIVGSRRPSLALVSSGVFSAAAQSAIKAMTKGKIITTSKDPLVPVGFDCSTIHEKGIDKQENFRAGAIMVACGEVPGVATSATSTLGPIGYFIKKLLMPLAFGAADVNLITGTETSPNITQSETFTTANPDNPNQIFVAYNDSRGRNASPINISGASVSTDGGATFTRVTTPAVKVPSPLPWATLLFCTTNPPALGSPSGLTQPAALRAWAGISPPLPRMLLAGPIFAFTITLATIANLVGLTTTLPPHSMGACIFPGATAVRSPPPTPVITASRGTLRYRLPPPTPSSVTCRSPATFRATGCSISPA